MMLIHACIAVLGRETKPSVHLSTSHTVQAEMSPTDPTAIDPAVINPTVTHDELGLLHQQPQFKDYQNDPL